MQPSPAVNQSDSGRSRTRWWPASLSLALIGLLALAFVPGNRVSGAGTLVVIEDASQMGTGSFSGNVCYRVLRDRDGVTVSEGCSSIAATIAAPEGLDPGERYSIVITLADADCVLLDDPRTGTGSGAWPFRVRVSCGAAYMTATASVGSPGAPHAASGTPAVDLSSWPPVYDEPAVVAIGPGAADAPAPMASPIPIP